MSECVGLTSHHTKEVHIRNQSEWMYFSVRTLENAHWDSWFISIAVLTHLQWNRRFINVLAFSQCFCYCFWCYFASLTYLEFDPIFIYVSTHFCNGFVPMVYDFMHAAPISLTSTVHTHTYTLICVQLLSQWVLSTPFNGCGDDRLHILCACLHFIPYDISSFSSFDVFFPSITPKDNVHYKLQFPSISLSYHCSNSAKNSRIGDEMLCVNENRMSISMSSNSDYSLLKPFYSHWATDNSTLRLEKKRSREKHLYVSVLWTMGFHPTTYKIILRAFW